MVLALRTQSSKTLTTAVLLMLLSSGVWSEQGAAPLESAALDSRQAITRLAFGSCFKNQLGKNGIWHSLARLKPQLFVFAGDTLYPSREDTESHLPRLEQAYDALADNAEFHAFRQQVPVLPVWDDHDYGRNDAGADFPYRRASEALFLERWGIAADDERRSRDGIYFSRLLGPPGKSAQLIVLDTRSFRSPLKPTDTYGSPGRERYVSDQSPEKTMLGDAQWRWLEAQLQVDTQLRLVVTSVQLLGDGHGWEGWHQLPGEQDRLLNMLQESGATPVFILSGDRHVAGFYERDIGGDTSLLEFTSSALNNVIPFPYRRNTLAEKGSYRLGELYGEANFGLLLIDWEAGQIDFQLHDEAGEVVRMESRSLGP